MGATKNLDLIGTIEDDAEVENLSEDSDAEVEVREISCYKSNLIATCSPFTYFIFSTNPRN